jgi:hypothetical protein
METQAVAHAGKKFFLWIDGVEYTVQEESLTGAEIKQLGSIPMDIPLVHELEDGTELPIGDSEVVTFERPGRRFMRSPRFKRG